MYILGSITIERGMWPSLQFAFGLRDQRVSPAGGQALIASCSRGCTRAWQDDFGRAVLGFH